MYLGYKIRLMPTSEQEDRLWKHIHSCRFLWNYMLDLQEERYRHGLKHLSHFDMVRLIKPLKQEDKYSWLNDVSFQSLSEVCHDLSVAYDRYFRKISKLPRFKSRKHRKYSFPLCKSIGKVYFTDSYLHVPKVGDILYQTDFEVPLGNKKKLTNPHIRFDSTSNKWIFSFSVDDEKQIVNLSENAMGIDLGIKEFAVVAFGSERIIYHNINKSKKIRKLVAKEKYIQRCISRKYKTNNVLKSQNKWQKSKSIEKYEQIYRKIERKISNIREDYLHQISHQLVNMAPCHITMETLDVEEMKKNRLLSKKVSEQCFNKFLTMMEYKSSKFGIPFSKADKFYPSSKTCSNCGSINNSLKLTDRLYVCKHCGLVIDRDYNAAINLMKYTDCKQESVT